MNTPPIQRTQLAFIWHMHQPYYRDMATGECMMPWARLHGIHSYYDMLSLYEKFPSVSGTINFVPSLVEQLLEYAEGANDVFLDHTLVPAENLSPHQKAFLLRYFFMANPEHKIAPYANYQKLFTRRGLDPSRIDLQQAIRFFSPQDYLDIQVYYNLIWFGFAAREEIPEINQMLLHGSHFSEKDKEFVIAAERRIIKNLIEAIRRASQSENTEICTTPYYHPIFPLLLDTSFAHRASPKAKLPHVLKLHQFAKTELMDALEAMERWTGRRPRGIWPAEGSVCPEMIPILADAGLKWMASDDRVLELSLPRDKKGASPHQPFWAQFDGRQIGMVFRDHAISDLISFTYSKMPAQAAVEDFLGHLRQIDANSKGEERLVTVILDGENPWEFYPNSGKEFLTTLFGAIEHNGVQTTTIGNYLSAKPPAIVLGDLHTGSWIDANFNIWIGKPQKNTGWEYIKRTLDELGEKISPAHLKDDPKTKEAIRSLCAAMGSDWFWWYDDDFDSAFKPDFDRIFRQHLKNAFTFLGLDIPLFLFEPIYHFQDTKELVEPIGFMDPSIDGRRTTFFEWANALRYTVHGRGGAMALGTEPFETISFGFNTSAFFVRIEPCGSEEGFALADDESLVFYLHDGGKCHKFALKKEGDVFRMGKIGNGDDKIVGDIPVRWAAAVCLEMAVPFAPFGFKAGEQLTIAIALNRHGVEARRYSHIRFTVPDEAYEQKMWSV